MRNGSVVAIDQDDALAPHYLPADLAEKFAVAGRRRQHWIWTLIVSTLLYDDGLGCLAGEQDLRRTTHENHY